MSRKRKLRASAKRMRALRWRHANGRLPLSIHVDSVALPVKLIALGRLAPDQEDDARAIAAAVVKLLDDLSIT